MAITKTAWIHPNPLLGGYVVLPDGYQLSREEALAKGFTVTPWPKTERTATPHPHEQSSVVLPRGQVVSLDTAKAAGFTVSVHVPEAADPNRSWRSAILCSSEAIGRASATVELVTTQTPATMPVANARAFLRGLPTEQTQEQTTMTNTTDPRAARLAEISAIAPAFNKSMGYGESRKPQAASASLASMDQTKLRRLSEIRLAALENNNASEACSGEAKKIRYALQVQGMALADVFAQLNLDTSKIVR